MDGVEVEVEIPEFSCRAFLGKSTLGRKRKEPFVLIPFFS
jgi:hypothetical protein